MSGGVFSRKNRLSFQHSFIRKSAADFSREKGTIRKKLIALSDCLTMCAKRAQIGVLIAQYLRKVSLIESNYGSIKLIPGPYDRLSFLLQSGNKPERPANNHQHSLADKAP